MYSVSSQLLCFAAINITKACCSVCAVPSHDVLSDNGLCELRGAVQVQSVEEDFEENDVISLISDQEYTVY